MAANFPYLASDQNLHNKEEKKTESGDQTDADKDASQRRRKRRDEAGLDRVSVFVWGLNDKNQLGGIKGSKVDKRRFYVATISVLNNSSSFFFLEVLTPTKSPTLSPMNIVDVTAGAKCIFVLTQDGKVYSSGEGVDGRLGLGHTKPVAKVELIEALSQFVVKKVAIHPSGRHCLGLTADGKVFSWGEGIYGKLGHGDEQYVRVPRIV